ncbi:hypothetical protein BpHYR1_046049 [Brachionus plicatilis]|uniref:Uncharacterized protein n=1 Tax=Brachionus plicatilis TaxID=10195 RepID=A0A3M7R111_BRAPC|nr:hypothetical protein BpHYR1_046049 [Brachionus plicatilis]
MNLEEKCLFQLSDSFFDYFSCYLLILLYDKRKLCLVGYNNGATYGQNTNLTNFFIFEILSLKEQQLFKGFAIFGTLGINSLLELFIIFKINIKNLSIVLI